MEANLQSAVAFATRCHADQWRDGPAGARLPYVSHCFDVLRTAWRVGILDGVTGPAALCHDVLEDCPGVTFADLAAAIGEGAADVVRDLTFHPDPADARPKAQQKADHLAHLATRSVEAVALKACDRSCNVTDFQHARPAYAGEYVAKGAAIFEAVDARRADIDRRWGTGTADRLLALRDHLRSQAPQ